MRNFRNCTVKPRSRIPDLQELYEYLRDIKQTTRKVSLRRSATTECDDGARHVRASRAVSDGLLVIIVTTSVIELSTNEPSLTVTNLSADQACVRQADANS